MNLADLFETHTVAYFIDLLKGSQAATLLFTTNDFDDLLPAEYGEDDCIYVTLFTLTNTLDISSEKFLFRNSFFFSSSVTFNGGSATGFHSFLMADASQTADKITVFTQLGISGSYLTSSSFDIDMGKTYALVTNFGRNSSDILTCGSILYGVDVDGSIISTDGLISGGVFGDNYNTMYESRTYVYDGAPYRGFIYEGDVFFGYDGPLVRPHRTFGCVKRDLVFTYEDHANVRMYLFPPAPAFAGSAYDRASILEEYIETLETDIETLYNILEIPSDTFEPDEGPVRTYFDSIKPSWWGTKLKGITFCFDVFIDLLDKVLDSIVGVASKRTNIRNFLDYIKTNPMLEMEEAA